MLQTMLAVLALDAPRSTSADSLLAMPAEHAHHAHFKLDNVRRILRYNVIMLKAASVTPHHLGSKTQGSKHMLNQHYTNSIIVCTS